MSIGRVSGNLQILEVRAKFKIAQNIKCCPDCCLSISVVASGENCRENPSVAEFDTHNEDNPSIFDDLTTSEMRHVVDFLMDQKQLGISSAELITIASNYILTIELLPPNKAEALSYLDSKGPKPQRYAKAIIQR